MSDSDEDNPIDTLILQPAERKAQKRRAAEQAADVDGVEVTAKTVAASTSSSKKKRKKGSSSNLDAAAEAIKPAPAEAAKSAADGATHSKALSDSKSNAAKQPAVAGGTAKAAPQRPIGVVVIEDGEEDTRNYEMQKLLRAPRYFDEVYEPKGVACWRCGKRGHLAKDCSLSAAKPCYYCAQYGHEPRDCPHRICYRCGEAGHMTKDCPLQRGQIKGGGGRGFCMRCGKSSCSAADFSDWYRFEGGCDQEYFTSDLDQVRCFVCGEKGHLSCQPAPLVAPEPSCWNCGGSHWAEYCPTDFPAHLMAERLQDRDKQRHMQQQEAAEQLATQRRQWEQQRQQELAYRQQQEQQQAYYQQQQEQQRYQQQQYQQQGYQQQRGGYGMQRGNGSWQQQQGGYQQPQQQQRWQQQQQGHQQQQSYQQPAAPPRWQHQQRQQQQQDDFPRGGRRHGGGGGVGGAGQGRKTWYS